MPLNLIVLVEVVAGHVVVLGFLPLLLYQVERRLLSLLQHMLPYIRLLPCELALWIDGITVLARQ